MIKVVIDSKDFWGVVILPEKRVIPYCKRLLKEQLRKNNPLNVKFEKL